MQSSEGAACSQNHCLLICLLWAMATQVCLSAGTLDCVIPWSKQVFFFFLTGCTHGCLGCHGYFLCYYFVNAHYCLKTADTFLTSGGWQASLIQQWKQNFLPVYLSSNASYCCVIHLYVGCANKLLLPVPSVPSVPRSQENIRASTYTESSTYNLKWCKPWEPREVNGANHGSPWEPREVNVS